IWFLINHLDLVAGNSGYHRAMLIDQCVRHFWDWWLFGVRSTLHWGWDLWDQANQFVAEAECGGLATLICFVLIIKRCFGRLGQARKVVEGISENEKMFWLFGAALYSHIIAFFGISYADQTTVSWYVLLALISAATGSALGSPAVASSKVEFGASTPRLSYN